MWICECCGLYLGDIIDDNTVCYCHDQTYGIRWSRIDEVDKFMSPFRILYGDYRERKQSPEWPESIEYGMISPHESQAERNHSQSLDQLNRRGGLSPLEIFWTIEGLPLCAKNPEWPETDSEAMEILIGWIKSHEQEYYF